VIRKTKTVGSGQKRQNRGQKSDDRKQKAEDRAGMAKRPRRRQGQKSKIRNIRSLLLRIIIL
jgi:hypothetical protein